MGGGGVGDVVGVINVVLYYLDWEEKDWWGGEDPLFPPNVATSATRYTAAKFKKFTKQIKIPRKVF